MAIRLHVHTPVTMHFSQHRVTPKVGQNASELHTDTNHANDNQSTILHSAGTHSVGYMGFSENNNQNSESMAKEAKQKQKQQYAEILRQQIETKLQLQQINMEKENLFEKMYNTPRPNNTSKNQTNHRCNVAFDEPKRMQIFDRNNDQLSQFLPSTRKRPRVKHDYADFSSHNAESYSPNRKGFLSSITDMHNPDNKQKRAKDYQAKLQWKEELEQQINEKEQRKNMMLEKQRLYDLKHERECEEYFAREQMHRNIQNGQSTKRSRLKDIAPSPRKPIKKDKDTHYLDEAVSFIPREAPPPHQSETDNHVRDINAINYPLIDIESNFPSIHHTKSTWIAPTMHIGYNFDQNANNVTMNPYPKLYNVSGSAMISSGILDIDSLIDDVFQETWNPKAHEFASKSRLLNRKKRILNFDDFDNENTSDELDALLQAFVNKR